MIYISTFLTLFAFTVMPSVAAPIPAPDFKTSGSLSVRTNVDIGPLGPGSNSVASAEVAYGPDEEGFFKRRTAKRSDAEEMNYDSIPFKRGLADPDVATGSLEVNYAQDEEGLFKRRADDMEVNYAPDEEGYFKRRTAKRSDAEEMNYDSIPFKREFALEANYAKDEEGLFKRRTDDMEVNYAPDEEGYFKRRTAKRSDAEEMGYDPTPFKRRGVQAEEMNYDSTHFKREPSIPIVPFNGTLDSDGIAQPARGASKSVLIDYSALEGSFKRDASAPLAG